MSFEQMKESREMSETTLMERTSVFIVEVSSNVYYVKKHRKSDTHPKYVDGTFVASALNSELSVAVKKLSGETLSNFSTKNYRKFLSDTLHREVL